LSSPQGINAQRENNRPKQGGNYPVLRGAQVIYGIHLASIGEIGHVPFDIKLRKSSGSCASKRFAMRMKRAAVIAILLSLTAGSAWAETTTGRITYISSDGHQLMLDSNYVYAVGANVSMSQVAVADRVELTFENRGGGKMITGVTLAPLKSGATQ
jgi:hypothetical protein